MAISGQQEIKIGLPNNPANSDSLYVAFNTIQNNFTTLFDTASSITNIVPGPGIGVTNNSSNSITITNNGVVSLVAGNNITITPLPNTTGIFQISSNVSNTSNGNGTVTSVGILSNTLGVSGSPITTSGNISVNLPAISNTNPNISFTNPIMSVDQFGRVRSITNGSIGITSIAFTAGNGIGITGSPVTSAGVIGITNTGVTQLVAGNGIVISTIGGASASTGVLKITATGGGGGNGGGTLSNVGIQSNNLLVTNSPLVTDGVIDINIPENIVLNSFTGNSSNITTMRTTRLNVTRSDTSDGIIVASASNDNQASAITVESARGNITTPAPVQNGDQLLRVRAKGYTTANTYQPAGGLIVRATANAFVTANTDLIPSRTILYSTTTDNRTKSLILNSDGHLVTPGRITSVVIDSTTNNPATLISARSRGTNESNVTPVNVGDTTLRIVADGYTGNGLNTLEGISGWSFTSSIESIVTDLPSSNGAYIPSDIRISTVDTSNAINRFVFTKTGNLDIPRTTNTGNLRVLSRSELGDVSNVKITGGAPGQFLRTDGTGNLTWVTGGGGSGNSIPAIYFTALATGNNQTFSNAFLSSYQSNAQITLFRNGALLENGFYTLSGNTLTVTTEINAGDSINIIAQSLGGNSTGNFYNLQADGNVNFNNSLSVELGSNVKITGGSQGDVLTNNGNGVAVWQTPGYDFGAIGSNVSSPTSFLLQFTICDFGTIDSPSPVVLDLGTF